MSVTNSPCAMNDPIVCNGVNVTALMQTIGAVKANAEVAKFNFRATNAWMGGDKNRSTLQAFTGALKEHRIEGQTFVYDNGEPEVLFGADEAPNPAEWLLHALIGCMTTSTVYHAAARGIEIRAIDSEIEGDIDLRGFLGISDKVRRGYGEIRVVMRVATRAPEGMIEMLTRMSPVLDVVSRSVPVHVTIETR